MLLPIDTSARESLRGPHGVLSADEIVRLLARYPRSPLRYPGGKSKAVKTIISCIPQGIESLCSPFFGGGSIELACTALGMEVHGYDVFLPLVDFWHEILENPHELADNVKKYFPLSKEKFYSLQKSYMECNNKKDRAAIFYVLNRCSFSGTTLSGGMSPGHKRFTQSAIDRVRNFKAHNLHIEQKDFKQSLAIHENTFLYLDPPYANGQAIYGSRGNTHKDFDHVGLSTILNSRGQWILSYNDCELVRKLYNGFQFLSPQWNYGMNTSKKSNEILIVSKDVTV